ncbi:hypothetical protein N7504_011712 [Penicillium tannophilum]|nr:hypothetical protein N7504_011712 [Penicillium tannophilum]
MIPRPPIQPEQRPQHQNKPHGKRTRISSNQEAFISITDKGFLRRYYEKIWENFQQTNCRVLAKAYIKLIEPRKQVTYPYNGRKITAGKTHQLDPNETKPPWWPTGVSHREPDHLPKAERIRLLVYILCDMRTSYGITAHKLKAAEQHIRKQIFPTERLGLLDEIYRVREEEEKFQDGFIVPDGKAMISISRSNIPGSAEGVIRPGKRNQADIPVDKRLTSKKAKPKRVPSCGGSSSKTNKPEPIFETYKDHPPSSQLAAHGPTWYTQQGLSIRHSYSSGSASLCPQAIMELQHSGSALPTTPSSATIDCFPSAILGSRSFLAEAFNDTGGFSRFQNGIDSEQLVPDTFDETMGIHDLFYTL